ncbi:MAG: thymidine phosphorylase, partial [Gammaproteobacteria bacterium]|nr:thymidine phosphorylase [Gammaproteobacteria bacterium]
KMDAIIKAQGVNPETPAPGNLHQPVLASAPGTITDIDNLQMANIARFAGAPIDKGAGVDLFKKLGDEVKRGEPLYRIHAMFPSDFKFAIALCGRDTGYSVGDEAQIPKAFVEF